MLVIPIKKTIGVITFITIIASWYAVPQNRIIKGFDKIYNPIDKGIVNKIII